MFQHPDRPWRLPLFLTATALGFLLMCSSTQARLDEETASRFARLALDCVEREYPNLIHHVMASDDEVGPPRKLTPSFYGCFDWHSAVHGHWLLVRLARKFPETEFAEEAMERLGRNLTEKRLLAEAAYVAHPERTGFERPYGLAWLLQLVAELEEWENEKADLWRQWLKPLEAIAVRRLHEWIPDLYYPIRGGEHDQTAFAFGLIRDYAVTVGDDSTVELIDDAARRFYIEDRDCPLNYEPSGHDFLSPCIAEADFMRRVLETSEFTDWLEAFLPGIGEEDWFPTGQVTDRADGKLSHIDGLNISRAWMLEGIAHALPSDHQFRQPLLASAEEHARAGLAGVSDEHYAGSHWLASFAVYLESRRGLKDD